MKKLFLLLTLSLITMSFVYAQEEKESKFSQKIQDTFFGVKFGTSSSDVIVAFENEELYFVEDFSSKDRLVFTSSKNPDVGLTFGRMTWHYVEVYLSNDTFYRIKFSYSPEHKETALKQFESMLSKLSSKYKMHEMPIEDKNTYKDYAAIDKEDKIVGISYSKNEGISGKFNYYVELEYVDIKLDKSNDDF